MNLPGTSVFENTKQKNETKHSLVLLSPFPLVALITLYFLRMSCNKGALSTSQSCSISISRWRGTRSPVQGLNVRTDGCRSSDHKGPVFVDGSRYARVATNTGSSASRCSPVGTDRQNGEMLHFRMTLTAKRYFTFGSSGKKASALPVNVAEDMACNPSTPIVFLTLISKLEL